MSKLHVTVTLKCTGCGAPMQLTSLIVDRPDPDGEMLRKYIKSLEEVAKCDRCLYYEKTEQEYLDRAKKTS